MLSSPGHSPRHLSTPSPSPNPNPNPNPNSKSNLQSSRTEATPRKANTVLDEDTYVDAIEKIIERDFFPDIPKLRDRLDWLEAIRTADPVQIRDAQLKILERRRGAASSAAAAVSAHGNRSATQTPSSAFSMNPSITPLHRRDATNTPVGEHYASTSGGGGGGGEVGQGGEDKVFVGLSLDGFFRRYTSEDNDSFSKLIEKGNRKKRERYGFLLEGENRGEDGAGVGLIGDGGEEAVKRAKVITDGFGTSDQPVSTLEGWNFTAKNLLMYHPCDHGELPLTEAERAERLKSLTKEISRTNTRFHGKMVDSRPKEEDVVSVLYTPVAGGTPIPFADRDGDKFKKYDLEELRKIPANHNPYYLESGKKAENGYKFVKTPSPAPGVDESPFMTWGEIEGTPLRLEAEDTPIDIGGNGDGPQFKIPMPPSRDIKAHSLSRDAARKLRERSKMFQKPPLPSPLRGGSASPRTLSPAAQKFMRKAIGGKSSSKTLDESLRESYRGGSPGVGPKSGRSMSRLARDGSINPPPW